MAKCVAKPINKDWLLNYGCQFFPWLQGSFLNMCRKCWCNGQKVTNHITCCLFMPPQLGSIRNGWGFIAIQWALLNNTRVIKTNCLIRPLGEVPIFYLVPNEGKCQLLKPKQLVKTTCKIYLYRNWLFVNINKISNLNQLESKFSLRKRVWVKIRSCRKRRSIKPTFHKTSLAWSKMVLLSRMHCDT